MRDEMLELKSRPFGDVRGLKEPRPTPIKKPIEDTTKPMVDVGLREGVTLPTRSAGEIIRPQDIFDLL